MNTLELADELMAMAPTIAAATSENGATLIREAAARLRLLHFTAPAAPEMLEALKRVVDWLETEFEGQDEDEIEQRGSGLSEARAAIAKATGGSHEE